MCSTSLSTNCLRMSRVSLETICVICRELRLNRTELKIFKYFDFLINLNGKIIKYKKIKLIGIKV
jgi:hypothetical protein